ncbi:MAG TPA: prepilin-type N-terminal cleavage/methylation domain-containing protein [Candidatus Saccharimonadales bacterium]
MIHPVQSRENDEQAGFSAVELLITLIIAAMFIISGYQLYSFTFARGTSAGQDARASDLAYDLLQEYKKGSLQDEANSNGCTEHQFGSFSDDGNNTYLGVDVNAVPVGDVLGSRDLTVTMAAIKVDCPTEFQDMARVTTSITYKTGSTSKTVSYASYETL